MPAALRTRLRPPSHPTRYSARSDWPSDELDVDARIVLRETRDLTSAIDRHLQLVDPAGQDALDVFLPEPEPVGGAYGKSLMSSRIMAKPATCAPFPAR